MRFTREAVTRLAALLLIGLLVNLAVTLACVLWSPANTHVTRFTSEWRSWPSWVPPDWPRWAQRDDDAAGINGCTADEWRGLGKDYLFRRVFRMRRSVLASEPEHDSYEAIQIRYGFPWRALRLDSGTHWHNQDAGVWVRPAGLLGGWLVSSKAGVLPLAPAWPGFAFNSLLFAAVLGAPLPAFRWIQRCRRLHRGLCPSCAYDLRALPPGPCPECGHAA
jgi:hypothetical protein